MADTQTLQLLSKRLTDEGKLIEAGWVGLRIAIPSLHNPSADELERQKKAFMAGAQHLFSSIMTILDPGSEPTENDLRRINLIDKELKEFTESLINEILKSKPTTTH